MKRVVTRHENIEDLNGETRAAGKTAGNGEVTLSNDKNRKRTKRKD